MKRYSPIHTLRRPGLRLRSSALAAAGALLCGLAGCVIIDEPDPPDEPELPGEPRSVRTSFGFQVTSSEPEYGMFLSLDEDPDARGQLTGSVTFHGPYAIEIVPTTATLDGDDRLVVAPGVLSAPLFYLEWETLELTLEDQDGDGVLESGAGRIAGIGVVPDGFDRSIAAAPDAFVVPAMAYPAWARAPELLPWEPIALAFRQPVSTSEIERYRVLAGGQEVPGRTQPQLEGALQLDVHFVPDGFHALGATIAVELDGMANELGVPMTLEHDPIQVMADPGPILSNLGFEGALAGWYAVGDAAVVDAAGELAPVEGAGMAALRSEPSNAGDSRLIGYLDVPAGATTLDLSLALLTGAERLPQAATVRLHRVLPEGGHEELVGYEFDHASAVLEPCACGVVGAEPLTRRAGPFRHEIDVTALRGERVFVEIRLDASPGPLVGAFAVAPIPPPPPPVPAILLVDDLQIR